MTATLEADIVIVGAGSAGCLLANRLSADPSVRVVLLEAGGEDRNPWIRVPLGYAKTIADPGVNWCYRTEPAASLAGRTMLYPLGRTLGGSSAINGLLWVHGQPQDFDGWATLAGAGWGRQPMRDALLSVERVLPVIMGDRGRDGGIVVSRSDTAHPLLRAAIGSGVACGLPANADYNSGQQFGIAALQVTVDQGRRVSAAHAFLHPVRSRPNLRVLTLARVHRVLFERGRAVGVTAFGVQGALTVHARREVVLSAGAVHSPQLMMLSGVGPADELRRLGIEPQAHSPDVGHQLQDHVQVRCVYQARPARGFDTLNELFHSRPRQVLAAARYALLRQGWLAQGAMRVVAFAKSEAACDPATDRPDLQLLFALFSTERLGEPPHRFPGLSISVVPLRPQSRGRISLASADPGAAPVIRIPLLEHPGDLALALRGIAWARRIAAQGPLSELLVREVHPGPAAVSDAALTEFARSQATTIFHPVGSCRMGRDDAAVVDPELRVRGVRGLRVVDASVMPTVVSGNTHAATLAIAERAAALIGATSFGALGALPDST